MEQNGKWIQTWRKLPAKEVDFSCYKPGDISKVSRAPRAKVGPTVTKAF